MRYIPIVLLLLLAACEARNFDSDKRQIIAKDQIRALLHKNRSLSILNFQEDTLKSWTDSSVTHPIRYTLDFIYDDSIGNLQSKKAIVIFTPQGNSILNTEITSRPLTDK